METAVPCDLCSVGHWPRADAKYYQPFGGENVTFEKEEVTEMKKFGEPGMSEQFIYYCWSSGSQFCFPMHIFSFNS